MILPDVRIYSKLTIGTTVYEEDDLHKPYFTKTASRQGDFKSFAKDEDLLYTFTNVQPRKGKEFREMELDIAWDEFAGCKLFATPKLIVVKFPNLNTAGSYTFIYGWIDDAEPVASKGPQTNTRIKWHVDWWLTWTDYNWFQISGEPAMQKNWSPRKVTIGAGRLLKGPASFARPSAVEARKWVYKGDFVKIGRTEPDPSEFEFPASTWAIMTRIIHNNNEDTLIEYAYWPLETDLAVGGNLNRPPHLDEILKGKLDEIVGGTPEDILRCWISPIPPYMKNASLFRNFSGEGQFGYAFPKNPTTGIFVSRNILDHEMRTDDRQKAVFVDCSRTPIFTAPWGLGFSEVDAWVDLGTSAAYLNIYLNPTPGNIEPGKDQEGRLFSTPLPTLPITGNAWSSYVYSGQRDYDIKSREIQRKENAVNGISGIAESAIGGAIAGSIAAPGLGTLAGLIGGAAASGISTAASFLTGGEFDGREQRAVDRLKSNQSAGMILAAGGGASLNHPLSGSAFPEWVGITMQRDPVSLAELDTAQAELGFDTDFYAPDCSELIAQGGPMRISGLQVKGDMPAEGKQYISTLFARGVNIDIIG